jgi:hypothetical protein
MLAAEIVARSGARQGAALTRALASPQQAWDIADQAVARELAALRSVARLTPEAGGFIEQLTARIEGRTADAASILATRPKRASSGFVPVRNPAVKGPLDVYYYDYLRDRLKDAAEPKLTGVFAYEALNLADGKRNVIQIGSVLRAAYGP